MITALDSFATLLQVLTRSFLLDPAFHPKQTKLLRAVEAHQKSFTSLKRNLTEAHSEWRCSPRRMGSNSAPYDDAVDSLNRLAQHLGGLRSGTRLQADLTKAHREGKVLLQLGVGNTRLFVPAGTSEFGASLSGTGKNKSNEDEEHAMLAAAAIMFGDLVDDLGPPMNALAVRCIDSVKSSSLHIAHYRMYASRPSNVCGIRSRGSVRVIPWTCANSISCRKTLNALSSDLTAHPIML